MSDAGAGTRVAEFAAARRDRRYAVLEGLHAIKHAARFGATFTALVTADRDAVLELARRLAPDLHELLLSRAQIVGADEFAALSPNPPETGVIAIAERRAWSMADVTRAAPAVWLEDPSNIGNVGAAIRAAAGAGAAGVITTGVHDPWHPAALRGSAGLHYALPVLRTENVALGTRRLIAIDGEGEPLGAGSLPADAIFAFGSERRGISPALRARADAIVAIPMEPGVSSLNLATAVAVTLYCWRLGVDADR